MFTSLSEYPPHKRIKDLERTLFFCEFRAFFFLLWLHANKAIRNEKTDSLLLVTDITWHHILLGHQHKPVAALWPVSNRSSGVMPGGSMFHAAEGYTEAVRMLLSEGAWQGEIRQGCCEGLSTGLCTEWASQTCLLIDAQSHDWAAGENLTGPISFLGERCWHSEGAFT